MASTRHFWLATAAFLVVAGGAGWPRSAMAGPLLETVVGANLGCNPAGPFGGPSQCLNDEDPINLQRFGPDHSYADSSGAGYISVSDLTDGFVDPSFSYFAQADAGFGALSASVSGNFNLATPDTRFAFASATSIELLTINAPGLDGTSGTLNVSLNLDGSQSSTGLGASMAQVGVQWGVNGPWGLENEQFFEFAGPASVNVDATFTYGTPFYLYLYLVTAAGTPLDFNAANPFIEVAGLGSGNADYFNTLTLTGLQARDASGNLVSNAEFLGASGTHYTEQGVVPEPAMAALATLGLAGALARARRARR